MNIVLNTNVVSPHVVPLALALVEKYGVASVSYVYFTMPSDLIRSKDEYAKIKDIAVDATSDRTVAKTRALEADVLIENVREFDVIAARVKAKKPTLYVSERWFKPVRIDSPRRSEYATGRGIQVSGFLKMLLPFALRRARQMIRIMRARDNRFVYLANGIHAARDMARLCGLMNGDLRCIFRAPLLDFERKPGGRICLKSGADGRKYCVDKMRMWGYFVETGGAGKEQALCQSDESKAIRVLWMGRLLSLKRVDVIIRAVIAHEEKRQNDKDIPLLTFDVYGKGAEEIRLRAMAKGYENVIKFHDYLPRSAVKDVMQKHDVFVLSSNAFEGWGAVVNEALEAGMKVVGTFEAGASATMLPKSNLYHVNDWKSLLKILSSPIPQVSIEKWTPRSAASALSKILDELGVGV